MKERIIAAIGALCIVLPLLIWGGSWGLGILLALICVIATNELMGMLFQESKHLMIPLQVVYLLSFIGFSALDKNQELVLAIGALARWVLGMFKEEDNEKGLLFTTRASFGLIYIPLLLSFFLKLRALVCGSIRSITPNRL